MHHPVVGWYNYITTNFVVNVPLQAINYILDSENVIGKRVIKRHGEVKTVKVLRDDIAHISFNRGIRLLGGESISIICLYISVLDIKW